MLGQTLDLSCSKPADCNCNYKNGFPLKKDAMNTFFGKLSFFVYSKIFPKNIPLTFVEWYTTTDMTL